MHLDEIARVIRHDLDPVAGHPVAATPVPFKVRSVAGRVYELEPLGGPEYDGPACTGKGEAGKRKKIDRLRKP